MTGAKMSPALVLATLQAVACLVSSIAVHGGLTDAGPISSSRSLAKAAFLETLSMDDKKMFKETIDAYISQANGVDYDECGKKLLCLLAAKKPDTLSWEERILLKAFGGVPDYSSASVQFQVAVQVGKKNSTNCNSLFPRCPYSLKELLDELRQQGISVDIPGSESDCSVYFLWRQNNKNEPEN